MLETLEAQRVETKGGYTVIYTKIDEAIVYDLRGRPNVVSPSECSCHSLRCQHVEIAFPQHQRPAKSKSKLLPGEIEVSQEMADHLASLVDRSQELHAFADRMLAMTQRLCELERTLEGEDALPEIPVNQGHYGEPVVMVSLESRDGLGDDRDPVVADTAVEPVGIGVVRSHVEEIRLLRDRNLARKQVPREVERPRQPFVHPLLLRGLQNLDLLRDRIRHRRGRLPIVKPTPRTLT